MNLKQLSQWVLGLIGACVAPLAAATILTIEAEGTVDFISNTNGFFSPGIAATNPGDPFKVIYFIDDTATTDSNSNPNAGSYNAALLTMAVTINNITFPIPGNFNASQSLTVFNDLFLSSFSVFRDALVIQDSGCQTATAGMCSSGMLQFLNSSTTAPVTPFTSDAFRALPGDLSQFQVASLRIGIGPGPTIGNPVFDQIGGTVTSVAITSPIPEPASLWMMVLGLVGLGAKVWRRQPVG